MCRSFCRGAKRCWSSRLGSIICGNRANQSWVIDGRCWVHSLACLKSVTCIKPLKFEKVMKDGRRKARPWDCLRAKLRGGPESLQSQAERQEGCYDQSRSD